MRRMAALAWLMAIALSSPPAHAALGDGSPVPADAENVILEPNQLRAMPVDEVTRVAVGDPEILDVTIVSPNEVLIQGKAVGDTNLILWDNQGQHVSSIKVVDRLPEAMQNNLAQLLRQMDLPAVQVKRQNGKLFLMGDVSSQVDADRLEQLLSAYPGVTNLTRVSTSAPTPSPAPLVKLSVQLIEINRSDLEKLGVRWSESIGLTEPEVTGQTLQQALLRWGTSLTRSSVTATLDALVEKNLARILAEPKLVTASGKQASSFIGLDVPIVTASSFSTTTSAASTSVEFRQTGVLLKMTPNVHAANSKITTVIEAEVSSVDDTVALDLPVGTQTVSIPGFAVRKANTEVTTTSGETIMIAGLLQAEDQRNSTQVPGLGSMPFLGRLFRSPEKSTSRRELVVAVTPELLADSDMTTEKVIAIDQALADVIAPADDPILRYALEVQQRIASALRYPEEYTPWETGGRVKLRMHVWRDGTLQNATVVESSGAESFDQAALRAAKSQSPFAPFPPDVAQQELWLAVPVLFDSNDL